MTDSAFQAELLLEHSEFVRRLARGLVRDPDRADDVVQETWLAALRNPPRARESAAAWFRSAARNVASKLDRGERRRVRRETAVATTEPVAPDAGELVHRLTLQRAAVDAVLALSEPTRTTIVLRYFEDLSPTEIADRLGVPRNTVRARLRRGLERLRADLDARHDGDRSRWLAAMLPLAGIEPATLAAGAAAGTIGTLGAWTMAAKSLSSVAAATAFSWVAWTLVAPPADGPEPK
ncbi:MAG: RNA polymerase sigma factor, partial [Planctomycetota bacterium JB042]